MMAADEYMEFQLDVNGDEAFNQAQPLGSVEVDCACDFRQTCIPLRYPST